MNIRKMEQEDVLQVYEIGAAAFSQPWSVQGLRECCIEEHDSYRCCYIVAEEGKEIVAYAGFWDISGDGQINQVAVKKEWQKQGIGHKLFAALLEAGKQMQLEKFTLEVRQSNQEAISLYQAFGFAPVGLRRGFYEKPKEDAVLMEKILSFPLGFEEK